MGGDLVFSKLSWSSKFFAFNIYWDRVRRKSLYRRVDWLYVWIEWHGGELKSHQSLAVIEIVTGMEMAAIKANLDHYQNRQDTTMRLNSVSLLEGSECRKPRVKTKYWRDGYLLKFDEHTLWYDIVWSPGVLRVIAPSPNNLWELFRQATFKLDGKTLLPRKTKCHYRHMSLTFSGPMSPPQQFEMESGGQVFKSGVSISEWGAFKGRNVLLQISRDNDLDWIADNIKYHRREHGLDAVVFIDNRSTAYSRKNLVAAIEGTGIAISLVISADFPFGPTGAPPFASREMFLQTAMYNIARHRWLGAARAVLCVDIDELVVSHNGQSIFDKTCQSQFGYVRFKEQKRFLPPGSSEKPRHRDHVFAKPAKRAETKWCIVPNGPADRSEWRVHKLEGSPFNLLPASKHFSYLHCIGLHTGWKSTKRLTPPRDTSFDLETKNFFDETGV